MRVVNGQQVSDSQSSVDKLTANPEAINVQADNVLQAPPKIMSKDAIPQMYRQQSSSQGLVSDGSRPTLAADLKQQAQTSQCSKPDIAIEKFNDQKLVIKAQQSEQQLSSAPYERQETLINDDELQIQRRANLADETDAQSPVKFLPPQKIAVDQFQFVLPSPPAFIQPMVEQSGQIVVEQSADVPKQVVQYETNDSRVMPLYLPPPPVEMSAEIQSTSQHEVGLHELAVSSDAEIAITQQSLGAVVDVSTEQPSVASDQSMVEPQVPAPIFSILPPSLPPPDSLIKPGNDIQVQPTANIIDIQQEIPFMLIAPPSLPPPPASMTAEVEVDRVEKQPLTIHRDTSHMSDADMLELINNMTDRLQQQMEFARLTLEPKREMLSQLQAKNRTLRKLLAAEQEQNEVLEQFLDKHNEVLRAELAQTLQHLRLRFEDKSKKYAQNSLRTLENNMLLVESTLALRQ